MQQPSNTGSQPTPSTIILQYYNEQKSQQMQISFPIQILNFNIQLLNHNHNEPYPIPKQIVSTQYPFLIIKQFLQEHIYSTQSFKVIKPINSKHFEKIVDEITYKVCQKFVHKQNAQKATQVVNLCRFLRFHQLHDAVIAAIATNYYIPPNNQKQLNEFKKVNKIDDLSSEEICQIIKEYEDIFNMIEIKVKEQFLRNNGQGGKSNNNQ